MGEMADFYIDQMQDGYDDDDVECKYCGQSGLHWEEGDGRFILTHSNGRIHKCQPAALKRAVIDDFEDVS